MCESQRAGEGRKLLKSLITHIKTRARVAITYTHLRICGSRKESPGVVIPPDCSPRGAEIHSNGLTTRDARGRNESNCYFLLGATLPLLISAEQFIWTVALVHDWTECEFPPRLTATGGVETAARLFHMQFIIVSDAVHTQSPLRKCLPVVGILPVCEHMSGVLFSFDSLMKIVKQTRRGPCAAPSESTT